MAESPMFSSLPGTFLGITGHIQSFKVYSLAFKELTGTISYLIRIRQVLTCIR